jgi:putrescine transport system ATP-binding protein
VSGRWRRSAAGTPAAPWCDPAEPPYLRLERVSKTFGEVPAVHEVSLSIYRGELFALLGPSGCGKTTLLRMLAGFEYPDAGRITIDGADMAEVPPYERPVNMMFQSYALFPHLNVEQNIAFGLHQERMPRAQLRERVAEALELVQLTGLERRRPHQLSGGQRQRVALARSLVKRPKLLLLDEPMAALDKKLRQQTQFELAAIQQRVGITFVMVTHDQEEAMTMASRIAVMDRGTIAQVGTPHEIYEYPDSRTVAEFIGSVNLFEGRVVEDEPDSVVIRSPEAGCEILIGHGVSGTAGATVWVALRPEKLVMTTEPPAGAAASDRNLTRGMLRETAYLGSLSIHQVELDTGKTVRVSQPNLARFSDRPVAWGQPVWLSWHPLAAVVLSR